MIRRVHRGNSTAIPVRPIRNFVDALQVNPSSAVTRFPPLRPHFSQSGPPRKHLAPKPASGTFHNRRPSQYSAQKCQTMPPPTKRLCWRLLPVFTVALGTADQKSLASPRKLSFPKRCTSRPTPAWNTPLVVPVLPGLFPPKRKLELSLKWPTPPPTLTQGETPRSEKTFRRAAGVTK